MVEVVVLVVVVVIKVVIVVVVIVVDIHKHTFDTHLTRKRTQNIPARADHPGAVKESQGLE